MDETLKVPTEVVADSPSESATPLATVIAPAAEAGGSSFHADVASQLKTLIAEALSQNTDLARLREINTLVTALLATQISLPLRTSPVSLESALAMRQLLRQMALDSYREEYKEFSDVWKALETKAQATVTIAGIFMAAAFTFAKDLAATRLDYYGNLFLGAAIILLIPTIICSVFVLWRRTVKSVPSGEDVESWADAIANTSDDDLPDRTCRFLDQHSSVWKETVASTKEAIAEKERLLHLAQTLLLFAIGAAVVVTLKLLRV